MFYMVILLKQNDPTDTGLHGGRNTRFAFDILIFFFPDSGRDSNPFAQNTKRIHQRKS